MKVKKYTAPTMPEAMTRIRKELGQDAVILNSKQVLKGGFLGFFKKRNIEVVAALDPQPKASEAQEVQKARPEADEVRRPAVTKQSKTSDDVVLNEIKHVRKMVEMQRADDYDYPADYQVMYHYLISQEIEPGLAKHIMDAVVDRHEQRHDNAVLEGNTILEDVQAEIESRLSELSFEGLPISKKLIQFVGPTGAGKTTTIAKVAASSMMNDNKQVALITADTYRIAAIEQLKTYANILDVPLEVVYDMNDYKAAVEKFESYDLILVDTAGRNFRDEKYIRELQRSITINAASETYLVLASTAKSHDIMDIYEQFRNLPVEKVIFTKVDETRHYGSIVNMTLNERLGIAFMTNGQDVPDDIIKPSPQLISQYIAGEYSGS